MKILITWVILVVVSLPATLDWYTDIEEAKGAATELDRKIILVFQGSDWCGPCIKLSKEVWDTNEFEDYADNNFIMLQADFPKRKKNALPDEQQEKNNQLAEQYNPNGYFPFVVVLDSNGNVLGETGYEKKSPADFIILLESF